MIAGFSRFELQQIDVTAAPGCPVISNKLRIERDGTDISFSGSYVTLYSYNGSGKFIGFLFDFNTNDVDIKLTIDGTEVIFELELEEIEDIARFGGGKTGTDRDVCRYFRVGQDDRLEFCPPCPIKFETSVLIEGKKNGGGSSKKLTNKMIFIEKVT